MDRRRLARARVDDAAAFGTLTARVGGEVVVTVEAVVGSGLRAAVADAHPKALAELKEFAFHRCCPNSSGFFDFSAP